MLLFLFSLALLWVFLHLISSFFPSHNSNFNGPRTSVTLTSYTSLHLSTTALNYLPLALVKPFKRKKAWLESYWDVGVVVVCLGIVAAQLVLGWTAWRSLGALWQLLVNLGEDEEKVAMRIGTRLMKRMLESMSETKDRLILRPVIPGLTQPLSALPLLLLALFISQTFHELGHALAAASESIPTLSLGIYLHLLLPTFYVSLPESNGANALAELRIATGGVWHNFVLVGLVWALSSKGGGLRKFGESFWSREVEGGVMVIDVDPNSPLHPHLRSYNLITHLNDLELDSSDSPIDLWSTYLSNSSPVSDTYEDLGWCLPLTLFDSSPRGCCDPSHQPGKDDLPLANPQLCFTSPSSDSSTQSACLDPLPYFPPSHSIPPRCLTSSSCVDKGTICARPELGEQVVRIGVAKFGEREREGKTIVWQGRRKGVLEHVSVTGRKPRFWFVPLSFSRGVERMYSHILSLSLAVAFFNLLPLPHLDGTHILTSFFQCLISTSVNRPNLSTLEEGRRSSRGRGVLEKQFERLSASDMGRWIVKRRKLVERGLRVSTLVVGGVTLCCTLIVEIF